MEKAPRQAKASSKTVTPTQQPSQSETPKPILTDGTLAETFSQENVMALQRTYGNTYVQRLIQRSVQSDAHGKGCGCSICGGGRLQRYADDFGGRPTVQRDLEGNPLQREVMSIADWKARSKVGDDGKKIKTPRSKLLKRVDKYLKAYHKKRGFPENDFGQQDITSLGNAINTWLGAKAGVSQRMNSVLALQTDVNAEIVEVNEMTPLKKGNPEQNLLK